MRPVMNTSRDVECIVIDDDDDQDSSIFHPNTTKDARRNTQSTVEKSSPAHRLPSAFTKQQTSHPARNEQSVKAVQHPSSSLASANGTTRQAKPQYQPTKLAENYTSASTTPNSAAIKRKREDRTHISSSTKAEPSAKRRKILPISSFTYHNRSEESRLNNVPRYTNRVSPSPISAHGNGSSTTKSLQPQARSHQERAQSGKRKQFEGQPHDANSNRAQSRHHPRKELDAGTIPATIARGSFITDAKLKDYFASLGPDEADLPLDLNKIAEKRLTANRASRDTAASQSTDHRNKSSKIDTTRAKLHEAAAAKTKASLSEYSKAKSKFSHDTARQHLGSPKLAANVQHKSTSVPKTPTAVEPRETTSSDNKNDDATRKALALPPEQSTPFLSGTKISCASLCSTAPKSAKFIPISSTPSNSSLQNSRNGDTIEGAENCRGASNKLNSPIEGIAGEKLYCGTQTSSVLDSQMDTERRPRPGELHPSIGKPEDSLQGGPDGLEKLRKKVVQAPETSVHNYEGRLEKSEEMPGKTDSGIEIPESLPFKRTSQDAECRTKQAPPTSKSTERQPAIDPSTTATTTSRGAAVGETVEENSVRKPEVEVNGGSKATAFAASQRNSTEHGLGYDAPFSRAGPCRAAAFKSPISPMPNLDSQTRRASHKILNETPSRRNVEKLPRNVRSKLDVEASFAEMKTSLEQDQKYSVQISLRRSRGLGQAIEAAEVPTELRVIFDEEAPSMSRINGMVGVKRSSPFSSLRPPHKTKDGKPDHTMSTVMIETLEPGAKRIKRPHSIIACKPTRWTDTTRTTPAYTHCTAVKNSVAAPNERVLQSYPYFGEDVDNRVYDALHNRYDVDVQLRQRKVADGQRSRTYAPYVRGWLNDIGISEQDVLYYLLAPKVDEAPDGKSFTNRDRSCRDDFARDSKTWTQVFSCLVAPVDSHKLKIAAWACAVFLLRAGFSLWQVVRKSRLTYLPEADQEPSTLAQIQKLACRVCHAHDCSYHVDFEEEPDSDSDDAQSVCAVEALDEDHPPNNNFKRRLTIPDPVSSRPDSSDSMSDEIVVGGRTRSLDRAAYKKLLDQVILVDNHDRNRFYPCFHPGKTCAEAKCKCFVDGVLCEKACGCSATCERKFQGCTCTRTGGRRVCYQDQRCDCFRLHRECDPDLCRGCGANVVLDPENRHEDFLRTGCCTNVNMQLGIPKRTLLGRSRIHGFGVYAGEKIKVHDYVGEYSGEIVLEEERVRRGEVYEIMKMSYLFMLTADQEVDSHYAGNKMRFVNHAKEKGRNGACNLRPEIVLCNMTPRIGMYATRDIAIGEELFFNYGDYYQQLLLDNGGAQEDKPEKDKAAGKIKREKKEKKKKRKYKRRKTTLTTEFAEPEYDNHAADDATDEDAMPSKKVTPRYKSGKESTAKDIWGAAGGTCIKSASRLPLEPESNDDPHLGNGPEDMTPRRSGRKRDRRLAIDESDLEQDNDDDEDEDEDEDDVLPRKTGRAKRLRYVIDDGDDEPDVIITPSGKGPVNPMMPNGTRKRGRPRKNRDEDE